MSRVRGHATKKWIRAKLAGPSAFWSLLLEERARIIKKSRDRKSRGLNTSIPLERRKALRRRAQELKS